MSQKKTPKPKPVSLIHQRFSIVAVNEAGAGPPAEANITTPESKGTGVAESLSPSVPGAKITFPGLLCPW